jgi:hypothetical protein
MRDTLAYLAAILTGLWGVAHVIPTAQVLAGFQPTSRDNRLVITQEWLAEALTMWGLAILVIVTTAATTHASTNWVYPITAALLVAIAMLTALTGARNPGRLVQDLPSGTRGIGGSTRRRQPHLSQTSGSGRQTGSPSAAFGRNQRASR